jgi:hypothetical protein
MPDEKPIPADFRRPGLKGPPLRRPWCMLRRSFSQSVADLMINKVLDDLPEAGSELVPTADYYLRQAEVTARMALAESDPAKAEALHVLALKYFEKAERAPTERRPHSEPTGGLRDEIQRQ